jgi:hypothetical protein
VGENGGTVSSGEGAAADVREADVESTASRTSRLERRLRALKHSQRQPETNTPLKLLTTDELRRAMDLIERAGVLPSGEVRRPEVFRSPPPEELEALKRWRELHGEPLDQLEAAEELLDRVGEAHGWHSPEAVQAALLLNRLELPDASPWFISKRAEAVLNLYAELEEHRDEPQHPHVRGAVRHLERLKKMNHLAPEPESSASESSEDEYPGPSRRRSYSRQGAAGAHLPDPEQVPPAAQEASEGRREPWWRRWFGG